MLFRSLADKAYIFRSTSMSNDLMRAHTRLRGDIVFEKEILKPIIKASLYKTSTDAIREYILFPYKKIDGKHVIIPEEELQIRFPKAYQYLLSVKETLDLRCNGDPNPVAWYAYGRSQALDTSFGKKILFSTMAKKPNFVLVENEETTFYSGYCIKYMGDYSRILSLLNSDAMEEFVKVSGRDFRDGWKSYSKRVIEEFSFAHW